MLWRRNAALVAVVDMIAEERSDHISINGKNLFRDQLIGKCFDQYRWDPRRKSFVVQQPQIN